MSYNGRIPVPGVVTCVRTTTREDRLKQQKRKEDELEKERKRQEEAQEAARILSKKWEEEDRRKREGLPPADDPPKRRSDDRGIPIGRLLRPSDDDRGVRRRPHDNRDRVDYDRSQRSADVSGRGYDRRYREGDRDRRDSRSLSRGRRGGRQEYDPEEDDHDERQSSVNHRGSQAEEQQGGWQTVSETLHPSRHEDRAKAAKAKKEAKTSKLQGIFGMGDSDDEKEAARSQMQRATSSKRPRLATNSFIPEPTMPTPASASSVADVQMKVAQWKASLKGKAATMPDWLQREVASVMGTSMIR